MAAVDRIFVNGRMGKMRLHRDHQFAQLSGMEIAAVLRRPEPWTKVLGLATLAGLECGIVGPFGSYPANLYTRVAYWMALFWLGGVILWPSMVAALLAGPRRGLSPLFSGVAVALLACVPVAAIAAAGCYLFWPVHASGIRTLEWYGLTILVALPAALLIGWFVPARSDRSGWQTPASPAARIDAASCDDPLPAHLLASALCLQMEDHHVRVHLPGGSRLHLGTMRQIAGGIDPSRGLRVHRSWWVARNAVSAWEEEGRAVVLRLTNGLRVPVARNRIAMLRAAGWLS